MTTINQSGQSAESMRLSGSNGVSLAADAWGDPAGRPVLLLHGGGQTRHSWAGTARSLAQHGFRAYAVDLRGHGDSDWSASGPAGYGLDQYADDVREIAKAVGGRPALVGASLGGLGSLLAAGEAPAVDASIVVLVDVAPQMQRDGRDRIGDFMRSAPNGFESLEEAAGAVAGYLPHRPRPRSTDGLRKNLRHGEDGRWRWHWDPAFMNGPLGDDLQSQRLERAALAVRCPIVLVRGGISDVVTESEAAAFGRLLPHAIQVEIPRAGHMVAGDDNDAFSAAVLEHLRSAS